MLCNAWFKWTYVYSTIPTDKTPAYKTPLWKGTRHKPEFALKYLGQLCKLSTKAPVILELSQIDELLNNQSHSHHHSGVSQRWDRPCAASPNVAASLSSQWHGQTHRRKPRPSALRLSNFKFVNIELRLVSSSSTESLQLKWALVRSLTSTLLSPYCWPVTCSFSA